MGKFDYKTDSNFQEFRAPEDKEKWCNALREAWELVPNKTLFDALDTIFDGYRITELTEEEQYEMMNNFIHTNS